ncbi:MAG: DNA polymerase III subunit beta [Bacteroidales bacterium]|jgi:DNA polymerase-3 subunit beta|nr:DNA polymerase III subunit beta [Bacteroidales bacterium]
MKFTVSSTDLLQGLLSVQKAIAAKSSLPILDNFLFALENNALTVTASDQETTLKTIVDVENADGNSELAIPAKLLTDSLRELPAQPIEFSSEQGNDIINISWSSGSANIPFLGGEDYPKLPELKDPFKIKMKASVLADGINNTIYATAEEELRPVMNGIFFDITPDETTLVASNAHKLVCYTRKDIKGDKKYSFILPKKPANILRSNLSKYSDEEVESSLDSTNAYFKFDKTLVVCRLVEGNYPAYKSVIPNNNTNIVTVQRNDIFNACKRVAVFSNQATSQLIFKLSNNKIDISGKDVDFSISAQETLACEYEGVPMEISFKSNFLVEILANLPYEQICIKLAEPSRAALIEPAVQTEPEESIRALLMPMRINN